MGALGDTGCIENPALQQFRLRATLTGLLQLDLGTEDSGFARAQLAGTIEILQHVELVLGGDAASRELLDAVARVWFGGISLTAGRMVAPFSLEQQWSDGNLPFLERSRTGSRIAPPHRMDGVQLGWGNGRSLEVDQDRSDTNNTLVVHATVGVFRPAEHGLDSATNDHDVIARVFVRRDRDNEYKSLDTYLELGASAAIGRGPDGTRRRYALEADARYYRYRASAELLVASLDTMTGRFDGTGGTVTVSATIPANRERWWTSPLPRYPLATTGFVSPSETGHANPGFELDLGVDAMRGTTMSFGAVRAAAHAFFHDYIKLSGAYTYTRGWGELPAHEHAATARIQLAF